MRRDLADAVGAVLAADSSTLWMPAHLQDQLYVTAGVLCQGAIFSSRWKLLYHFSLYLPNNWKIKHVPSWSISFLRRSHWNVKLLGNADRSLVTSCNSLKQWILNKLESRSFWIGLTVRFYLKALIKAHSLIPPGVPARGSTRASLISSTCACLLVGVPGLGISPTMGGICSYAGEQKMEGHISADGRQRVRWHASPSDSVVRGLPLGPKGSCTWASESNPYFLVTSTMNSMFTRAWS